MYDCCRTWYFVVILDHWRLSILFIDKCLHRPFVRWLLWASSQTWPIQWISQSSLSFQSHANANGSSHNNLHINHHSTKNKDIKKLKSRIQCVSPLNNNESVRFFFMQIVFCQSSYTYMSLMLLQQKAERKKEKKTEIPQASVAENEEFTQIPKLHGMSSDFRFFVFVFFP